MFLNLLFLHDLGIGGRGSRRTELARHWHFTISDCGDFFSDWSCDFHSNAT